MSFGARIRGARTRWLAGVTFCDACGQVCDAACRANAVRERARVDTYHRLPRA